MPPAGALIAAPAGLIHAGLQMSGSTPGNFRVASSRDGPKSAARYSLMWSLVGWKAQTSDANGMAGHITKDERMSLLMVKQGVKDKFTLIAAIITDDDAEPIEHLKRLFQPKALPSEHYEVEVHPTPTGIAPEFKNRLITDQKTLDGLEEIVRANVEGRN
jgi:hypothetical protein